MFTRLKPLIILLVLIIPSITFFFKPGIYWNMHDDMQLIRQLEMEKCFQDGQIPCRWTPDLGYGYGYPLFNFYPPLPYFVGEGFRVLGFSFISTVKLTAALQFIVAAFGMYILVNSIFGPISGLVAALLYNYAPYHSVNVYIRGAMNEAWAAAFFPFIFYFARQAIIKKDLRSHLFLSLSYGLLLLSHNPMALVFSPFLGIWLLYWLISSYRITKEFFIRAFTLGLSLVFSVFISGFFTFPVLFESKMVQIESMFQNYYHFSVHFVSFYQLFLSNFWGDGPSVWGTADGMSFSVGYIHWIVALITLLLVGIKYFKTRQISWLPIILFGLSFFSIFMAHERSTPIWSLLSIIQKVQFPWRFLNISAFLLSLLAGTTISLLPQKSHYRLFALFAITLSIFIFYSHLFTPVTSGPINDDQKFSGKAWVNQVTGGIYDYLPKTAQTAAKSPASDYIDEINLTTQEYVLSGQKKGTDWLFFNISLKKPAKIILPVLYFPDFNLSIDNTITKINHEPSLGRITFDLTPGDHQIYLKLHDTPIRTISNILSLFSLILFSSLLFTTLWKSKKLKT
ncbi:MAG: 6-pyruvoyl-tetrahydropterin synthase-related protein [Candidatus Shapirobacteria bacterium]